MPSFRENHIPVSSNNSQKMFRGISKALTTCKPSASVEKFVFQVATVLYPCYENMTINDSDGVAQIEEDLEGGPTSFVVQVGTRIQILYITIYSLISIIWSVMPCSYRMHFAFGSVSWNC